MKILKNKGIGFYLNAVATILALVVLILGISQKGLARNTSFGASIIIPIALGIVVFILSIFFNYGFMPLILSISLIVAFGFVINQGAEVINDKMLNIEFSGGNFAQVLIYLIGLGIAVILTIVVCFLPDQFKKKQVEENA